MRTRLHCSCLRYERNLGEGLAAGLVLPERKKQPLFFTRDRQVSGVGGLLSQKVTTSTTSGACSTPVLQIRKRVNRGTLVRFHTCLRVCHLRNPRPPPLHHPPPRAPQSHRLRSHKCRVASVDSAKFFLLHAAGAASLAAGLDERWRSLKL